MTKTTLLKSHPFSPKNKVIPAINVSTLTIGNDPLPTRRSNPDGKYVEIFNRLKPGQCIKCPSGTASRLGQALRKWVEVNQHDYRVSATERYEKDSFGRVWLLAAKPKAAA